MAVRRSKAESATCSWTPKASCSRRRYTAPRCWTRRGSNRYLSRRGSSSCVLNICGSTAAYRGKEKGKGWVEKTLGWTVELVERPRKPAAEEVLKLWAKEWSKEGVMVDREKLLPPRGFIALPRRWVVERTFAWLSHNRRMSKDYERLCATSEAFIYVAMTRLMVRWLAHA